MAVSAVTPLNFHDNAGTMAMIHAHMTQLYALVTSPHVETVYSLYKLNVFYCAWSINKQSEVYEIYTT